MNQINKEDNYFKHIVLCDWFSVSGEKGQKVEKELLKVCIYFIQLKFTIKVTTNIY